MKSTEIKFTAIPSTEEVKAERDRLAYRSLYGRVPGIHAQRGVHRGGPAQ